MSFAMDSLNSTWQQALPSLLCQLYLSTPVSVGNTGHFAISSFFFFFCLSASQAGQLNNSVAEIDWAIDGRRELVTNFFPQPSLPYCKVN